MRQDRGAVDVDLVLDVDVVTEDRDCTVSFVSFAAWRARQEEIIPLSRRAHLPMREFQPTMVDLIQAWSCIASRVSTPTGERSEAEENTLTVAFSMMTHRWRRAPAPILTPGPTTTFGPTTAVGSIVAVGCTITLPSRTQSFLAGSDRSDDLSDVRCDKYKHVPER